MCLTFWVLDDSADKLPRAVGGDGGHSDLVGQRDPQVWYGLGYQHTILRLLPPEAYLLRQQGLFALDWYRYTHMHTHITCRKSTYMPIRSHSRHGNLISQLDMWYSLFSQCHFHIWCALFISTSYTYFFFLSFFFFFAHTTFNRAIAVLFHPRREGSISCVSASDPSYLKTRQWAQSNALGQPLHRNTLVHPQHAIISLCM